MVAQVQHRHLQVVPSEQEEAMIAQARPLPTRTQTTR